MLFEKYFKVNFKLKEKNNNVLFFVFPDIGTNLKIIFEKGSNIDFAKGYAETKILKVVNTSRTNGFPLLCTLEKI